MLVVVHVGHETRSAGNAGHERVHLPIPVISKSGDRVSRFFYASTSSPSPPSRPSVTLAVVMSRDNYLVIGGSGFLGRHIVEALVNRGDAVSVLDIVQRYHDVPFYMADISVQEQVEDVLRKVCSVRSSFILILICYRAGRLA